MAHETHTKSKLHSLLWFSKYKKPRCAVCSHCRGICQRAVLPNCHWCFEFSVRATIQTPTLALPLALGAPVDFRPPAPRRSGGGGGGGGPEEAPPQHAASRHHVDDANRDRKLLRASLLRRVDAVLLRSPRRGVEGVVAMRPALRRGRLRKRGGRRGRGEPEPRSHANNAANGAPPPPHHWNCPRVIAECRGV